LRGEHAVLYFLKNNKESHGSGTARQRRARKKHVVRVASQVTLEPTRGLFGSWETIRALTKSGQCVLGGCAERLLFAHVLPKMSALFPKSIFAGFYSSLSVLCIVQRNTTQKQDSLLRAPLRIRKKGNAVIQMVLHMRQKNRLLTQMLKSWLQEPRRKKRQQRGSG
jgi:hypothetical protein